MKRMTAMTVVLLLAGRMTPAADTPALERLRADADKALAAAPHSVMEKTRVPPSGDKHDYLSLAPYSWPDPAKPDGLPWITRDGEVNPLSREGSDIGALRTMAADMETLALAYHLTGHGPYAAKAAAIVKAWFLDPATRMNPNLEYAQGIPGRTPGRGTGIIDTVALIKVVQAVGWLDGSRDWTPELRAGLTQWFRAYLDWMLKSRNGVDESRAANNHGSWYLAQTAVYAVFVGDAAQARRSVELGRARIAAQIEPDGRQPLELRRTKSYSYSLFNIEALLTLAECGASIGVDLFSYRTADGRSLRGALDAVAPYMRADAKWPGPQIKEIQRPDEALASLLRRAANAYREPGYEALIPGSGLAASRFQVRWPPAVAPEAAASHPTETAGTTTDR